jgi:hypothetical protein
MARRMQSAIMDSCLMLCRLSVQDLRTLKMCWSDCFCLLAFITGGSRALYP